jgi:hypothetical protein
MAMSTDLLVPAPDKRQRLEPIDGSGRQQAAGTGDLEWLQAILGVDGGRAPVTYLARVVGDEVRFLAPAGPGPAAAASLRRAGDARSRRRRIQGTLGAAAGRLGLFDLLPATRLTLPAFELVHHLAGLLDEPELVAAITLGPRRRNRKPVLQLLAPDGRAVGFAKVGWSPLTCDLVDNEADVLDQVAGRLPAGVVAPAVIHHGAWRGRTVIVISALTPRRGRAEPGPDLAAVARAVSACAAEPPTAVADLKALAGWRHGGLDNDVDLDGLVARHGPTELPVGLWHGDFTPWNMATGAGTTWLWDWELAQPGRPLGFDLLHHRFEQLRRAPGGCSARALAGAVSEAEAILAPLGAGLSGARGRAVVDLYLCELIARERRLANQRWGSTLADLGPAAVDLLGHRLRARR